MYLQLYILFLPLRSFQANLSPIVEYIDLHYVAEYCGRDLLILSAM